MMDLSTLAEVTKMIQSPVGLVLMLSPPAMVMILFWAVMVTITY